MQALKIQIKYVHTPACGYVIELHIKHSYTTFATIFDLHISLSVPQLHLHKHRLVSAYDQYALYYLSVSLFFLIIAIHVHMHIRIHIFRLINLDNIMDLYVSGSIANNITMHYCLAIQKTVYMHTLENYNSNLQFIAIHYL